jgi:small subunit ribosomal protein S8
MSFSDPIADMLTRIRNGQKAKMLKVSMPYSGAKNAIANVLIKEGFISSATSDGEVSKKTLTVGLKYFEGSPVIDQIRRFSKPGLRRYKNTKDIPKVLGGLGCAILSTSSGVMTDKEARLKGIGGEVLFIIS